MVARGGAGVTYSRALDTLKFMVEFVGELMQIWSLDVIKGEMRVSVAERQSE